MKIKIKVKIDNDDPIGELVRASQRILLDFGDKLDVETYYKTMIRYEYLSENEAIEEIKSHIGKILENI